MNNPFTFRPESLDHFPEAEEFDDEWMYTPSESGVSNDLLPLDSEFEWDDERISKRRLFKRGQSTRLTRPLSRTQPQFRRNPPRPGKRHKKRVIARPNRRRVLPLEPSPCICPTHGSEYVRWVQSSLNQILAQNLLVTGVMNPATRKALRQFQQQQGLRADGIAGPDTKRALLDAIGGGTRDSVADPAKSTDATEPAADSELFEYDAEELEAPLARPILRRGSRGASVIELQRRLTSLAFDPGAADGIFGSRTESAVKSFQRSRRITADGIVGSQTWSQLYGPPPSPTAPPAPSTTIPYWSLPTDVRAAGDALTVRYDSPPAWANGANCTSYTDGAAELRRHILATFPGITSIGGYNCRANSANPSETSVHGVGRALDVMIRPVNGRANSAVGDPIANWLVRNAAEIGVQYIIWNRVRWSGSRIPRVASYGGPNPHIDHIHVELNLDGARRSTPWFNRAQSVSRETLSFGENLLKPKNSSQYHYVEEDTEGGLDQFDDFHYELDLENTISATDYIKWVQRSLNRILHTKLPVDGTSSLAYREAVRRFNEAYVVTKSADDKVDENSQNALIKSNEKDMAYLLWVQQALHRTGAPADLVPTGIKDKTTKKYIQGFQAFNGLRDDGFIGAKTETALIKASGIQPPGHIKPNVNPVKPNPEPQTHKPLTREAIEAFVWAIIGEAPSDHEWRRKLEMAKLFAGFLKTAFTSFNTINGPLGPDFFLEIYRRFQIKYQEKPYVVRGTAMGMAYAVMDFATRRVRQTSTLREPLGIPSSFRKGFYPGYKEIHSRLSRIDAERIPAIKELARGLQSVNNRERAIGHIYYAIYSVFKVKESLHKYPQESSAFLFCQFRYPLIKTCCGPRPNCRLDL